MITVFGQNFKLVAPTTSGCTLVAEDNTTTEKTVADLQTRITECQTKAEEFAKEAATLGNILFTAQQMNNV